MAISLTKPDVGSTNWGTAVNNNWQLLMDALNGTGSSPSVGPLNITKAAIGYPGTTTFPTDGLIVNGNVGIGTSSPGAKLDIIGKTLIQPGVSDGSTAVAYTFDTSNVLTTGGSRWVSLKNGGTEILSIGRQITWPFGAVTLEVNLPGSWNVITSVGRLDLVSGTSLHLEAGSIWFSGATNLSRSNDASSTATQSDSRPIQFQTSLWDGAAQYVRYAAISTIASTTVNGKFRLAFLLHASEKLSIDLDGNVGIGTTAPNTTLHVNGGHSEKRTAVANVDYNVLVSDFLIAYTTLSAARIVTLPAPSAANAGQIFLVKNETANTHGITVQGASSTVDGAASIMTSTAYGIVRVYSNGSNYFTF